MKHLSIIIRRVKVIPEVKLRKLPTGPIGFEVKAPSLLILGCISRSPSNLKKMDEIIFAGNAPERLLDSCSNLGSKWIKNGQT